MFNVKNIHGVEFICKRTIENVYKKFLENKDNIINMTTPIEEINGQTYEALSRKLESTFLYSELKNCSHEELIEIGVPDNETFEPVLRKIKIYHSIGMESILEFSEKIYQEIKTKFSKELTEGFPLYTFDICYITDSFTHSSDGDELVDVKFIARLRYGNLIKEK